MAQEAGQGATSARVSIPPTQTHGFFSPYIALEGLQHCSSTALALQR